MNDVADNSIVPLSSFGIVSNDDVMNILKSHGMKSSIGDPLPSCIMLSNRDTLLPYLTKLVNLSFSQSSMDGLKDSTVLPLLKKPNLDPNILSNFRPISTLPFLSKVIERIVLKKLNDHMSTHNLSCHEQFGYKKHHSTETLLVKLLSDIYMALDTNFGVVVVSIDFSSAFDTVDHNLLL